jgi:small-conductance mechanosensitive channel
MQVHTAIQDAVTGTHVEPVVDWFLTGPELQVVVVVVLLTLGVSRLVEFVSVRYLQRAVEQSSFEFDDVVFKEVRQPLFWTIVFIGLFVSTLRLSSLETSLPVIESVVITLLVALWARALIRIGNKLGSGEAATSYGSDMDFLPIFQNIWTILVLILGAFFVLSTWNISVTPLLASAGVAGIAVGFAAKDTVANFFGALALYFDDTYRVGDYIELDSGIHGEVAEVSIRSTVIRTRDDLLVTVPNSVLNSAVVTNQSAPYTYRRIRVPVSVAYGTDIDRVESILAEAAENDDIVVDKEGFVPRIRFLRFGPDGLEYELRCWVPNPDRRTKATHQLNREIYGAFAKEGIEIPFQQRDVWVREPGDKKLVGDEQ